MSNLASFEEATHVSLPWVQSLQGYMKKLGICLKIPAAWTPKKLREGDWAIMDGLRDIKSKRTREDINAYRMYLRLTMVSEITTNSGSTMGSRIWRRTKPFIQ